MPGPGDVVAVAICADGIGVDPPALHQDTIIEVFFLGDGCPPGYWKQPQHLDSWPDAYDPDDVFSSVFGVGPDITLLHALGMNGGGEKACLRHATAALLNAASPDVLYSYSVVDVISMVQDAYASGDLEDTKDLFEAANENWCPLD